MIFFLHDMEPHPISYPPFQPLLFTFVYGLHYRQNFPLLKSHICLFPPPVIDVFLFPPPLQMQYFTYLLISSPFILQRTAIPTPLSNSHITPRFSSYFSDFPSWFHQGLFYALSSKIWMILRFSFYNLYFIWEISFCFKVLIITCSLKTPPMNFSSSLFLRKIILYLPPLNISSWNSYRLFRLSIYQVESVSFPCSSYDSMTCLLPFSHLHYYKWTTMKPYRL